MKRFADKRVIVSGGGTGIGRASAHAFAREGARVACLDIAETDGRITSQSINANGGESAFFPVDVRDIASIQSATEMAVDFLGGLDIAHNNAGANGYAPVHEMSVEMWDHIFAVNSRGVFLSMKYQIPHMLSGGGAIVITGSVIQHGARPGAAAYAASKHALAGLAQSAALDYGAAGIRVNVVAPGTIDTPMVRNTLGIPSTGEGWERVRDGWVQDHMPGLRRMGEAEEIAAAVLMLASEEASFITGITLHVDGGMTAALS